MKVEAVKAFHYSNKFLVAKVEYATESYLKGVVDCKAKVQGLLSYLNLGQLDIEDEAIDAREGVGSSNAEVAPS